MPTINDLLLIKVLGALVLLSLQQIAWQLRKNEDHLVVLVDLMMEEDGYEVEHDPIPLDGLDEMEE